MWQYATKILVTAVLVVAISETAKRSTLWGAALASLPVTSMLAFIWLHVDGADTTRIAQLSHGILWLVLPSLVLFLVFPALLRIGWTFWASLAAGCAATAAAYVAMVWGLERLGIHI